MKTFLLTPAIALLNQLPYRRKFILISVAIFIPLAVLTYLFVSSLNDSITFNAKERTGIEYIKVARTLLLQVQNHLNVSDAALNDVWAGIGLNAQQELVDVALKAVEAVDQKLGGPDKLNTAEKWPPVKEKWQSLKDQTLSIKDNLGTHAALLGDITALIAHVGDTSNLILDPDLDTYYLMAQEVLRFPSIMNNLQQARMLGKEVLARKSMTSEEKTQLIFLFSRISADLDTIKNDIAVVFRENTAVKTELSTRFDTATTAISIFQDILGKKIIKAPQLVLSDYAYAEQASKAIGDVFKLYSAAEPILDRLIQKRVDHYQHIQNMGWATAIMVLLLVSYLFMAFYISVNAEKALWQLAGIVGSSEDAVIGLTQQGIIATWNKGAEKIFGYAETEIKGRTLASLYAQQERNDDILQLLNKIYAGEGSASHYEAVWQRQLGEPVNVSVTFSPIKASDGAVTGISAIARDITEQKKAQMALQKLALKLEKSNRELMEFTSIAAHDLQEPLRKISVFGDRLKNTCGASLSEEGRDYLERMQHASRRMQALINDLLTLSRITTLAQPFVATDLKQIAQEVVADLEIRIEQSGGQVELGKLPTIDADPLQMHQLLQNLIGNALKFKGEAAPKVKIYQQPAQNPADNSCTIVVEDNGIGFDEKYLDRIFVIFERLHGREEYEGTGIGLSICHKIVERHGGTITARSQPGLGAIFIVTLPLKQVRTAAPYAVQIANA